MIFDHPAFPKGLKSEIYESLRKTEVTERKPTDTDEQFFYKTRKKALGVYKRQLWGMSAASREAIGHALEEKFAFLLTKLRVANTRALVEKHAPFVAGSFPELGESVGAARAPEDVRGLSD